MNMPLTPNTILRDYRGTVKFDTEYEDTSESWQIAKDVVDYPVKIVQSHYKLDDEKEEYKNANGVTRSGRERAFNLVLVDMFREGDDGFQAIAAVSDQYGTVRTTDIYEDFRVQLEELAQEHRIRKVYVSPNGGTQTLIVQLIGMKSLNTPDDLVMEVRLLTSVDGSLSHSISVNAYNKSGDTSIYVYGGEYNLSARHTTTLGDRTVNFVPQIIKMITHWNTVIIPAFDLMFDSKFDRKTALEFLDGIAEEAGIGERHRTNIESLYRSVALHTKDKTDSVYRVNYTLNQYIDSEMEGKPELQNKFKDAVARRIHAYIQTKKLK